MVFELPFYSPVVGGITETIKIANRLGASIRFQRASTFKIDIPVPYTIGKPNRKFPECDVCVTYSDTPYMNDLVRLQQVKKVVVYMMSYGMNYFHENKNATRRDVTCVCTTKKIEEAIIKDGGKPKRVGFTLDMGDMFSFDLERKNYLAIMYHYNHGKRYDLAVKVADLLYEQGVIDGVITFGSDYDYNKHKHPKALIEFNANASRQTVRDIFNECKCFLMPSISEGLNLTPVEATLCNCPAVIVDGAIGEVFFEDNCFIAEKDNIIQLASACTEAITNFDDYSIKFRDKMQTIVDHYTWADLLSKLSLYL